MIRTSWPRFFASLTIGALAALIVASPAAAQDTGVVSGDCYVYTLRGTDRVGNSDSTTSSTVANRCAGSGSRQRRTAVRSGPRIPSTDGSVVSLWVQVASSASGLRPQLISCSMTPSA